MHTLWGTGTVYNHRASVAIEAMLTDAFIHADSTLRISDSIASPADFLTMSDSLIQVIERSKETSLKRSREIVHRIRRRHLYRFVDEVLLPADRKMNITPEDVSTCQDAAGTGVALRPEDIHIAKVTLNFGMEQRNPVDNVLFFKNWYVTSSLPEILSTYRSHSWSVFVLAIPFRYAFVADALSIEMNVYLLIEFVNTTGKICIPCIYPVDRCLM